MFRLAQTVGHKAYTPGAVDSHNNPVDAWADPVSVEVYGYGPPNRTPEAEPGGTQVIEGMQILAPVFAVDPRDQFVVDGDLFEVEGEVANWSHGPFGFQPGMTIQLKRVEGGV